MNTKGKEREPNLEVLFSRFQRLIESPAFQNLLHRLDEELAHIARKQLDISETASTEQELPAIL